VIAAARRRRIIRRVLSPLPPPLWAVGPGNPSRRGASPWPPNASHLFAGPAIKTMDDNVVRALRQRFATDDWRIF